MSRPPSFPVPPLRSVDRLHKLPYSVTREIFPLNKIRCNRVTDWRKPVTVCIAAICDSENRIVTATDLMISTGETSGDDIGLKQQLVFHPDWILMFAGDDLSYITPICDLAEKSIDRDKPVTVWDIEDILVSSYQDIRKKTCERRFLSPFGLNMESFLRDGKKIFTEADFSSLMFQISRFDLGCQFLVAGFHMRKKLPYIFTVSNPGSAEYYDKVGFWAIGSGQRSALSSLFFKEYNIFNKLNLAIYTVYEAKLMAEKALGVGRGTLMTILEPNGKDLMLFEPQLKTVRTKWKNEGSPKLPAGILKIIDSIIAEEG